MFTLYRDLYTDNIVDSIVNEYKDLANYFSTTPIYFLGDTANNYEVDRILYNDKKGATTVKWADGTYTVVKKAEGSEHDPYLAFAAALAKKVYGSNSAVKRILNTKTEDINDKKH